MTVVMGSETVVLADVVTGTVTVVVTGGNDVVVIITVIDGETVCAID